MNWKRLLLPLLLCAIVSAGAPGFLRAQGNTDCTEETWVSVGGGLSGQAVQATEMDGKLYVIHKAAVNPPTPDDSVYQISAWDGSSWQVVTTATVRRDANFWGSGAVLTIAAYKGELYIGGRFASVDGVAGTSSIARWDGSAWNPANTGLADLNEINVLTLHEGKLCAGYSIYSATQRQQRGVATWDGSSWTALGPGSANTFITSLISWKGDLYAGGWFGQGGVSAGVAKWNGTAWEGVGTMSGSVQSMIGYKNELYIAGQYLSTGAGVTAAILRWDGTTWANGNTTFKAWYNNYRMAVHDDQLFVVANDDSGMVEPGVFGTNMVTRFDGTTWHTVSNFDRSASFIIEHDDMLYAGGFFKSSCGNTLNYVGRLCDDASCARISGNVYWDMDGNCTKDGADEGVKNRVIEILPGPYYANTDADGNYALYVLPGSYTVGLAPYLHWNQTCPTPTHTYDVDLQNAGKSATGKDFGAAPIPNIQDLRVSLAVGRARTGRPLHYALTYSNVGTVTMSGTVSFFHDPLLTFDSASVTPTRYTPNLAQWDFTDLKMGESRTITIYTTVPRSAQINDNFCSMVKIDPQMEQLNRDDRDTICVPVTGGYDPNDIRVTPMGLEENGEITRNDSVLTYHVRFQNTGNDTAFKVVVVDTLSPSLDPRTIVLGAASHNYTFSMAGNGILTWTFDNIMLPDSGAHEPNSHGFYKYSVNLRRDLPTGTQIPNRVSIYFDYNAPVATNTVISVISGSASVTVPVTSPAFSLYPNPAHGMLYLNAEMSQGARVTVTNTLGQTVQSFSYDGSGRMELNVTDLPAGAYWITIPTAKGMMVERVTVVK